MFIVDMHPEIYLRGAFFYRVNRSQKIYERNTFYLIASRYAKEESRRFCKKYRHVSVFWRFSFVDLSVMCYNIVKEKV